MKRGLIRLAALLLVSSYSIVTLSQSAEKKEQPKRIAIKAGRLIDTKTGAIANNAFILIEGDKITAVGPDVTVPAGAEVIDLKDKTVLPGLIDCHTHMTSQPGNYYEDIFRKSPIDVAVIAHVYARRTLEAGFTTVRDVGAGEFIDVALRNAINRGDVVGPRMQVATLTVGATGGHGDINGFSPYLKFGGFSGLADGVDEIRKLIRFEVKYGADLIKMLATAGVLSEEESVGAPQFSQEEMNAIVEEAKMWGKRVAAHAHGAEGIKRAVRAGVTSIEHGSLIDDEGVRMMKERGTYLVADIYNDDYILAEFGKLGYPDKIIEKERMVGRTQRENFQKAAKAGVKLAYGTDAGVYPHGWNGKQFAHMVKWGLTPTQAIQAATVNAADLLGWNDKVGVIAPGAFADIIAVDGDPLKDVTELERVKFVMKGGVIYKK
ncbi:MAG TPA: amidohydrolase family protein [Blastocatellia bacterium]|nr:amidohydrolase family protein [Blastocatellia bacterium]